MKCEPTNVDDAEQDKILESLLKRSLSFGKRDIMAVPQIKNNPLSVIIIKKYMEGDKIAFDKLIKAAYRFSNTRNLDEKLRFLFGLYDNDNDDHISSIELYELLKTLNKGILEDWKLQNVVDKTFADVGEYTTKIDFNQFRKLIVSRSTSIYEHFDCDK